VKKNISLDCFRFRYMKDRINNIIFFILYVLMNPKLIFVAVHGIYLPVYVQYEWLTKQEKINTIVDVGAYLGRVSQALKYLLPDAKVFAFDPVEENYAAIKKTLGGSNGVTVEKAVVSDKEGKLQFYKHVAPQTSSLLKMEYSYEKQFPLSKIIDVKSVTLDNYFQNLPLKGKVFLKIDTQGSEISVLKGADNFLKKVSVIHIEVSFEKSYRKQSSFEQIYKFLEARGFIYIGDIPDAQFYPIFSPNSHENFIFVASKGRSLAY
jgi:FkbM family methyltransferase